MSYKINPRYGCEVYIGPEGYIRVFQEASKMGGGDDATLMLAPDEAQDLIRALQNILRDLAEEEAEEESDTP